MDAPLATPRSPSVKRQTTFASLKAAGGALFAGLPVFALVALLLGGGTGVLLLLIGCLLLRRSRRASGASC